MEQDNFEQTLLNVCSHVPKKHRNTILHIVEILARELQEPQEEKNKVTYNVDRHREIRRLTSSIQGSLASEVSAERDEHG
jgi:hypothetical protein